MKNKQLFEIKEAIVAVKEKGTNKFKLPLILNEMAIDGHIKAQGEVTAFSASDSRLKERITPITSGLSLIERMNPVMFRWNSTAKELNNSKDDRDNYGLIAQELEGLCPSLIHNIYGKYKSVDYVQIIAILIAGMKELKQEINELKN